MAIEPIEPISPGPGPSLPPPLDLCQRINFRASPVVRNGVGYTGWVSGHRTLVTPRGLRGRGPGTGDCKRICAQLVLNPGRGTVQLQVVSEELLAVGGFLKIGGHTQAALRAAVRGTITIWVSTQQGIPVAEAVAAAAAIAPPGVNQLCEIFDDPRPLGFLQVAPSATLSPALGRVPHTGSAGSELPGNTG